MTIKPKAMWPHKPTSSFARQARFLSLPLLHRHCRLCISPERLCITPFLILNSLQRHVFLTKRRGDVREEALSLLTPLASHVVLLSLLGSGRSPCRVCQHPLLPSSDGASALQKLKSDRVTFLLEP